MSKLESAFKAKICDELRECGALIQVIDATAASSGWPDRFVIHPLWAGYIEFKRSSYDLKENQRLTLREIAKRKFPAVVVKQVNDYYMLQVVSGSGKPSILPHKFNTGRQLLQILVGLHTEKFLEIVANS